jgi:hypothetical protein
MIRYRTTGPVCQGFWSGSDGTRTRDLRRDSQITTPAAATSIRLSNPKPMSATEPAAIPAVSATANSTRCQAFL